MPSSLSKTLAANGDNSVYSVPLVGEYLSCYDQSGLVEVELYLGNELKEVHTVERFVTLNYKNFDHVKFRNLSGKENEIVFFYGLGVYQASQDRALVTVDNAGAALTVKNVGDGANVLSDVIVAPNSSARIFGSSENRLEAHVESLGENIGDVRIAPHSQVGANKGSVLMPYGTAMYKTKTEVWVHNPNAESIVLTRNELLIGIV